MTIIKNELWKNPITKFWINVFIAVFALIIILCGGQLNPPYNTYALLFCFIFLLFILLIEEFFLVSISVKAFSTIQQKISNIFKVANRKLIYNNYLDKKRSTVFNSPAWDDDEFCQIADLNHRIKLFVKASIDYQEVDFDQWKKQNIGINLDNQQQTIIRSFWIILSAIASFLFLIGLLSWLGLDATKVRALIENSKGTVLLGIFTTFIGAPIIFIVWLFRDKNNRVQIENARKDTNLKDFQKLSEWASGFHLPELKRTQNIKHAKKFKNGSMDEYSEEETTNIEDFLAPDGSNSISRRQGAEALQASAIAQLEAFMFGKYGEQFMQPAFLLIHAIWESIITQQQIRYPDLQDFHESLELLHRNPIISALNKALAGAGGAHLRLFENNLSGLNFSALNTTCSALRGLNLAGCNLAGSNFSYVELSKSNFVGANLKFVNISFARAKIINLSDSNMFQCNLSNANFTQAQLIRTNLVASNLQKSRFFHCNLMKVNLSRADLSEANLSSCNLSNAYLFGVDLTKANLSKVNLYKANLSNCFLSDTKLYNTDLSSANLAHASFLTTHYHGAIFEKTIITRTTIFRNDENQIREDILSRGAIWDDDPEWLVGKIQNAELLEKIRQDHLART